VRHQFCTTSLYLENIENYTNCNECLRVLNEIKLPIEDMFVECKFGDQLISCKDSLEELVIGKKWCYVFNALKIYRYTRARREITDDWNIDDGYKTTATLDAYPRRALKAGPKFGLTILLRNRYDYIDYFCNPYSFATVTYLKSLKSTF
jgi:acid-sensing ion channel, other